MYSLLFLIYLLSTLLSFQDLVEGLSKGDLTVVSEKAATLTDAQKTRISLARYL